MMAVTGEMAVTVGATLADQRPRGNHLLLGKNSQVTIFRQDYKILPVIILVASILLQLYLNVRNGFVDKHRFTPICNENETCQEEKIEFPTSWTYLNILGVAPRHNIYLEGKPCSSFGLWVTFL